MALIELAVNNLAVIESVRLSLGRGLVVVTGETGAGKSRVWGRRRAGRRRRRREAGVGRGNRTFRRACHGSARAGAAHRAAAAPGARDRHGRVAAGRGRRARGPRQVGPAPGGDRALDWGRGANAAARRRRLGWLAFGTRP